MLSALLGGTEGRSDTSGTTSWTLGQGRGLTPRQHAGQIVKMSSTDVTRFGSELRRLRRRAGLSQAGLASRVGWDHSTVSKYERGIRKSVPARSDIHEIERAIGLSDNELLLAAGYQPLLSTRDRRSLSYGGQDLTPEQEREVLQYIDFVRQRDT